jgi:hypothetical protein
MAAVSLPDPLLMPAHFCPGIQPHFKAIPKLCKEIAAAESAAWTGKERRSRNDPCRGFPTLKEPFLYLHNGSIGKICLLLPLPNNSARSSVDDLLQEMI